MTRQERAIAQQWAARVQLAANQLLKLQAEVERLKAENEQLLKDNAELRKSLSPVHGPEDSL